MGPLDVFLRVSFAGFAAILATVSVQSYMRHRERRFLLLTGAFGIFLIEGLWLLVEMATMAVSSVGSEWLALNLAVLVSLYLALLRGANDGRPGTGEPPQDLRFPGREPGGPLAADRTCARDVDRHAVVPPRIPRAQRRPEGRGGRPSEAVLHRPRVRRGAATDPGGAASRCPEEDPRGTPDVRRADVRGAAGIRRRVEVDPVVSPPEADASGPARPDETGAGERLHDQGLGGSPEAPPGEPVELP